jgi:TRAP-type transport system small permease protein
MQTVRTLLGHLLDGVVAVFSVVCVLLLVLVVGVVTANVTGRYFFGRSVVWAGEASTLSLLWMVFLGAAIGYRRKMFPAFTAGVDALPHRIGLAVKMVVSLVNLAAFAFLVHFGWQFADRQMALESPLLGLSMGQMYLAIPISGLALVLMTLEQMLAPQELAHDQVTRPG